MFLQRFVLILDLSSTCMYIYMHILATFHQFRDHTKLHEGMLWRFFRFFSRVHNHIIAHSAHKNRHEVSDLSGKSTEDGDFVATKDGWLSVMINANAFLCGICHFYETRMKSASPEICRSASSFKGFFPSWIMKLKSTQLEIRDFSSWWFQPISKISVKSDHFPK